jgi:hypothetical protein
MPGKTTRHVRLSRLDGSDGVFNINACEKWQGMTHFDWGIEVTYETALYRTKAGRWVIGMHWGSVVGIVWGPEDLPPDDSFREVSIAEAADWFVGEWIGPSRKGGRPMPREIEDHLAGLDIDSAPPAAAAPAAGTTPEGTGTKRKRRNPGEAQTLLDATLDSLIGKGEWGKTREEIASAADISRSQMYEIIDEDKGDAEIRRKLMRYEGLSRGKGPPKIDDL